MSKLNKPINNGYGDGDGNGSLEMTDSGDGWLYLGNGGLYSDGTDFSSLIFEVDKVAYDPLLSTWIPDIGNPLLREISRRRGIAFATRWVDFLDLGTGWRVGTVGFSA